MSSTPRHQLGDIVAHDLGDELVLAKEAEQHFEIAFGIGGTGVVLPDLDPISASDVVQSQRGARALDLPDQRLSLLTIGRFYFVGFALGRDLGRAVKAMTSELEVEVPERRARLAEDGHGGDSFRV